MYNNHARAPLHFDGKVTTNSLEIEGSTPPRTPDPNSSFHLVQKCQNFTFSWTSIQFLIFFLVILALQSVIVKPVFPPTYVPGRLPPLCSIQLNEILITNLNVRNSLRN